MHGILVLSFSRESCAYRVCFTRIFWRLRVIKSVVKRREISYIVWTVDWISSFFPSPIGHDYCCSSCFPTKKSFFSLALSGKIPSPNLGGSSFVAIRTWIILYTHTYISIYVTYQRMRTRSAIQANYIPRMYRVVRKTR